MPVKGRKPKPTHLKIIEGDIHKAGINHHEPKPRPVRPPCPKHLSTEAKREWKRVAAELERIGLLTQIDKAALAGYCQAWARWVQAEELLRKTGPIIQSPTTKVFYQSPILAVCNKAMEQMLKFLSEFGMTPSSRTRIKIIPDDNSDGNDLLN